MNHFLHLSKFEFTSKINDIAFKKSIAVQDVEKQYFFELIVAEIKSYAPNLLLNITFTNKAEGKFIIDGNDQNIKQNYWDFFYLCNFLTNSFKKLQLHFHYVEQKNDDHNSLQCSLYYKSVFTEKESVIIFTLNPADVDPEDYTEPDSDSKPSSSGGVSQELIKIDQKEIANFSSQKIDINSQQVKPNFIKPDQKINIKNLNSFPKNLQTQKSNIPVIRTQKSTSPITKVKYSSNLETNREVTKVTNVLKSVIKNNPQKNFNSKKVEKIASKIIPESSVKTILENTKIKEEFKKYNDVKYESKTNIKEQPQVDIKRKLGKPVSDAFKWNEIENNNNNNLRNNLLKNVIDVDSRPLNLKNNSKNLDRTH